MIEASRPALRSLRSAATDGHPRRSQARAIHSCRRPSLRNTRMCHCGSGPKMGCRTPQPSPLCRLLVNGNLLWLEFYFTTRIATVPLNQFSIDTRRYGGTHGKLLEIGTMFHGRKRDGVALGLLRRNGVPLLCAGRAGVLGDLSNNRMRALQPAPLCAMRAQALLPSGRRERIRATRHGCSSHRFGRYGRVHEPRGVRAL